MVDGTASDPAGRAAIAALRTSLPPEGSLLALDLSKRRIGLAGTDLGRQIVRPLHTLERRGMAADIARLRALCEERQVVALVVGLPLDMDGSDGKAARTLRGWARHLAGALALPVFLQDERLSSEAVRQALDAGRLRRPKPDAPLDHYAAAVILEDALRVLGARPAGLDQRTSR